MDVDPGTAVPNIVFGVVAFLIGAIGYMFRKQIHDRTVAKEREHLPNRVGDALTSNQSPFWVGAAGVGGMVLGTIMFTAGVLTLVLGGAAN